MSIEPTHRFDLLVRGGTVVRADGSQAADVAVRDGRIVAVEAGIPRFRSGASHRRRPACWCCRVSSTSTPTPGSRRTTEPDRFFLDTVAAAFGGTTTMLAFNNPGTGISVAAQGSLLAGVREWLDRTRGDAAIDVGLSAVITAQQDDPAADLPAIADLGVTSGKCFLVYDFGVDEARLAELLRAAAAVGTLLEVHGEDRALLDAGIAAQLAAGETGPRGTHCPGRRRARRPGPHAPSPSRPRPGRLCTSSTSRPRPLCGEIARARRAGQVVYGETCPHYLSLDASRYERPPADAMGSVISPPLRTPDDQAALWQALLVGDLDLVATDHVPDRLAVEKRYTGQPFPEVSNGAPGIETLLSVTYATGVAAGRMSSSGWWTCWRRRRLGCSGCPTRVPSRQAATRTWCCSTPRPGASSARLTCTTRATSRHTRACR